MADLRVVSTRSRPPTKAARDLHASTKPWLVKGVLPTRGVAFMVGSSRAGKSFVALDWSLRMASGYQVLDRKTRTAGVIYVAAEDGDGVETRADAWFQHYNANREVPFHQISWAPNLLKSDSMAELGEDIDLSCDAFVEYGVTLGLIVIDTLSCCIPGAEEVASPDMSRAYHALKRLAADFNCLVLVVAHYGKAGEERGIRGWSGWDAHSDATVAIDRDGDERSVIIQKVKNAPDGANYPFGLETVTLDQEDEDGDPITSCVPVLSSLGLSRPVSRRRLGDMARYIEQAFDRMRESGRLVQADPPDDLPRFSKAVRLEDLRVECGIVGLYDSDDTSANMRQKWHRAKTLMIGAGRMHVRGPLAWIV